MQGLRSGNDLQSRDCDVDLRVRDSGFRVPGTGFQVPGLGVGVLERSVLRSTKESAVE